MGTTLTGTTPQDTYDSLIKVTDNGPIDGTLKVLSDGLGNDSALSLSTGAASITGTLAVSVNASIGATPESWFSGYKFLQINNFAAAAYLNSSIYLGHNFYINTAGNDIYRNNGFATTYAQFSGNHVWQTAPTGTAAGAITFTERMRITDTGNVGIGTAAPARPLSVAGIGKFTRTLTLGANDGTTSFSVYMANEAFANNADTTQFSIGTASGSNIPIIFATNAAERVRVTDNGLTFNGDTAAANALDDYEEGTWTPTSDSAGYTISAASGSYTKIGRQVVIRGSVEFSAVDASSTSLFIFLGLPFTPNFSYQGSCRENSSTGAVFMVQVRTTPDGILNSMDGVTTASQQAFAISRAYIFTLTYFV